MAAAMAIALLSACLRDFRKQAAGEELPGPEDILASLDRGRPASLSGKAEIELSSPEVGYIRLRSLVSLRLPASARMDISTFFEQPLGIFACDGEEFSFYSLPERKLYRGSAASGSMEKFLPLKFRPSVLARLLAGRPPLQGHVAEKVVAGREKGRLLLLLASPAAIFIQALHLDAETLDVLRSSYYEHDELLCSVEYGRFTEKDGRRFPATLSVSCPSSKLAVKVAYSQVIVEPELRDSIFRLNAPAGVEVEEVDEACRENGIGGAERKD